MFDSVLRFIGQNWLATIISITAIIYAIYEARRRRGPLLAYQFVGQRLIGSTRHRLPDEIQITFRNNAVTNLSQTQIVVWNDGDAPLRRTDVATDDPIAFTFGDGKILVAEVVKVTRDVNKVRVEYEPGDSSQVSLKFEFLDAGDGALLNVWHNADDAMPEGIGTILGQKDWPASYGRFVPPNRRRSFPRASNRSDALFLIFARAVLGNPRFLSLMPIAIVLAGMIAVGLAVAPSFGWNVIEFESENPLVAKLILGASGLMYALLGILLFLMQRRRFPKQLTPDEVGPADSPKSEAKR